MQELNFIIFYTAVILFIAYFGGALGVNILTHDGLMEEGYTPTYNPLEMFGIFVRLFTIDVLPEFKLVFTLIFVPYLVGLSYIVWKALPFT